MLVQSGRWCGIGDGSENDNVQCNARVRIAIVRREYNPSVLRQGEFVLDEMSVVSQIVTYLRKCALSQASSL